MHFSKGQKGKIGGDMKMCEVKIVKKAKKLQKVKKGKIGGETKM